MSAEFEGCLISMNCGEEGIYQGIVRIVNADKKNITIENPIKNGYALKDKCITIPAARMIDLKVCKMPSERKSPSILTTTTKLASSASLNQTKPSLSLATSLSNNKNTTTNNKTSSSSPPSSSHSLGAKTSIIQQQKPRKAKQSQPQQKKNQQNTGKKVTNSSLNANKKNTENLIKLAAEFKGCLISVDRGEEGLYQGIVLKVDVAEKSITIEKTFREGYPLNESVLTIKASQMLDLKILKMPIESNIMVGKKTKKSTDKSFLSNNNSKQKNSPKEHSVVIKGLRNSINEMVVTNKMYLQNNKKVNNQNNRTKCNSFSNNNNKSPITEKTTHRYKSFGEFRHFQERQIAAPMRLKINKRGNAQGPSGIPLVDCSNGYTSIGNEGELGDPIDFALLNTDFDFDGNLALFNKSNFVNDNTDVDGIGDGDSIQIIKRNFRNDENVLTDPSRVTSWTQKNSK